MSFPITTIDCGRWRIIHDGRHVDPSRSGFLMVQLLALRPGVVREWGEIADRCNMAQATPESISSMIRDVRKRLVEEKMPNFIQNRRGIGYVWDDRFPVQILHLKTE